MASLISIYRVGRDTELRYTGAGEAVCNISLAYPYGPRAEDGSRATQWLTASLWGERAERYHDWLTKGREVYAQIEDLHIETFKKGDGSDGVSLVGKIGQLEFVGRKPEKKQPGDAEGDGEQ